jgi:hypothetical protein
MTCCAMKVTPRMTNITSTWCAAGEPAPSRVACGSAPINTPVAMR